MDIRASGKTKVCTNDFNIFWEPVCRSDVNMFSQLSDDTESLTVSVRRFPASVSMDPSMEAATQIRCCCVEKWICVLLTYLGFILA